MNERRLTPVFAQEPAPLRPNITVVGGAIAVAPASPRDFLTRRLGLAALIGVAVILFAAGIPAVTTLASSFRSSSSVPASQGPPAQLRAAAGVGGNWERSYSQAQPSAQQLGAALMAGAETQHGWDVLKALRIIDERRIKAESSGAAVPYSYNGESGYAAGTVLRARITIYGCTGPGGGFCNNMASGGTAFEGAAACSSDLPFGTKLTIDGDPTGRVYECLDRGLLPATWIDVYFENTSDGIAWQSSLGTTTTDIQIVN